MNITVPQNIQTKTELEEISDVKHIMISAGSSAPIMGLKQDGILGAYNLTKPYTKVDWRSFMNMVTNLRLPTKQHDEYIIHKNKIYTGHEVFSHIIPERINKSNFGQENEILIKSGNLISGFLKKNALGEGKTNNLIQLILDEYNDDDARDFFDNSQKLINQFNLYNGFSVGLSDIYLPKDIGRQVNDLVRNAILKSCVTVTEYENNPDMLDLETFETSTKAYLDNVMNDASSIISKNMTLDNSINVMATAGSKGNSNNTGQMIGLLGQIGLEGKRIPMNVYKRSLPYFFRNDYTAQCRGFVQHSFLTGANYSEFVMHNMSSREGLIDTAVKTAETGYTQRKLTKLCEDMKICYDGTVRNATDHIIQFIYGDCGTDSTRQYNYKIDLLLMSDDDIMKKYKFDNSELKQYKDYSSQDNDEFYKTLIKMRNEVRKSQIKNKMDRKVFNTYANFMLPINMLRIIDKVKELKGEPSRQLTPKYVLDRIDTILQHTNTRLVCVAKNKKSSIKLDDEILAKTVLRLAIYNALSPKRCIIEYKMTKDVFEFAMNEIIAGFKRNQAAAGEMVGTVGVQALMPPLTQMTLNTFHQSGLKSQSTMGVPRLKELFSLTKSIKTPQMIVYLNEKHQNDKEMAYRISAHMKQTNIIHIRDRIDIYYDPNPTGADNFATRDNIGKPFYSQSSTGSGCQKDINNLPWLARIEINREKMLAKDVSLLDIQSKFCHMWTSRFQDMKKASKEERSVLERITKCGIASNSDNDDIPIIHIRFDVVNITMETLTDFVDIIIDNLKIKGIDNVTDVYDPVEDPFITFDKDTHAISDQKEYAIYVDGLNMYDIRNIENIDINRTICNDVMKVYEIFGIEAARIALLREITTLLERAGNTFINYQHLSVIVDLMTRDGIMISIDRHGMSKTETGPLGKASFEKPIEHLVMASVFNEKDPLKGVSARIMTGQVIRGGTGMCDLMFDSDMVEKSEYIEDDKMPIKDTLDESDMRLMNDVIKKKYDDIFIPE